MGRKAIRIHLYKSWLAIEAKELKIGWDGSLLVGQQPFADDPGPDVLIGPLARHPVLTPSHPLSQLTPGTFDIEARLVPTDEVLP